MLFSDRGQVAEPHTEVRIEPLGVVGAAAEDGHFVASYDHPLPDLLHARLEPAVARGHPASSDERDMHRTVKTTGGKRGCALLKFPGSTWCTARPSSWFLAR